MSRPRSRSIARRFALASLAAAAAAAASCADTPLAPAAGAGAPSGPIAAGAFGFTPDFATVGVDGFQERFTHTSDITIPEAPGPWEPAGWSVVRHQRDPQSWYRIEPMMAWHGTGCQRPDDAVPANRTHLVTEYRDMVFLCRNHMMTATNASGYGVVYVTPGHLVDFSERDAVVRFDVATLRESGRDWIDLWLTPYAENLVAPLDDSLPDLQGAPRRAVHVRMTAQRGRSAFDAAVVRNHAEVRLRVADTTSYETAFAARGLAPSATRRDTFELHVSRTRVRFGMPRYNLWWVDAEIPGGLDWSRGVIQIGHHSFDPAGDGGGPTSWHWDNIGAAPAVPFTIVRARSRYVDASTPDGEAAFASAAPEGAYLRAAVIGATEVSVAGADGRFGAWAPLALQAQRPLAPQRFASAWMAVPTGTVRARFRPVRAQLAASGGRWMVRDLELWATPAGVSAAVTRGRDRDDDAVAQNDGRGARGAPAGAEGGAAGGGSND
jgi:hypothetical protein